MAHMVDPFQIADQLCGDPSTGHIGSVSWPDLRQHGLGMGGGQIPLRPAWDRLEQHAGQMSATRLSVRSRNQSDGPGAWTRPRQVRPYRQYNKQPRFARHDCCVIAALGHQV